MINMAPDPSYNPPGTSFESHIRGELEKIRLQIEALNQSKISSMEKFREIERES